MTFILFLISFTKLKHLVLVFLLLFISTLLEYGFVISVPFFFEIIFQEQNQYINYFNNLRFLDKSEIFKLGLVIIVFFFVIKNIFYFTNQYFFLKYSFSIHNNLTRTLFAKYLNTNYQIFINSESSLLIRNVVNNTGIVRSLILNLITLFSEILVFVGLCLIVIYQSTLMSLFSIAFIMRPKLTQIGHASRASLL